MRRTLHILATFVVAVSVSIAGYYMQQTASAAENAVEPAPAAPAGAAAPRTTPTQEEVKAAQIERGRYLANDVALCVVCHTPKDGKGLPIRDQAFHGGVIPAKATYPDMQAFATNAPALGPMAGGAPEDVAYLLETGIWRPTGKSPKAPMPPFRLSKEDAEAVVAYLRSLQTFPPQ